MIAISSLFIFFLQSVTLALPDYQTYTFLYDDNRNLQTVSLPSGATYRINRQLGIGFRRTEVTGIAAEKLLVIDENDRGRKLSVSRPGKYTTPQRTNLSYLVFAITFAISFATHYDSLPNSVFAIETRDASRSSPDIWEFDATEETRVGQFIIRNLRMSIQLMVLCNLQCDTFQINTSCNIFYVMYIVSPACLLLVHFPTM